MTGRRGRGSIPVREVPLSVNAPDRTAQPLLPAGTVLVVGASQQAELVVFGWDAVDLFADIEAIGGAPTGLLVFAEWTDDETPAAEDWRALRASIGPTAAGAFSVVVASWATLIASLPPPQSEDLGRVVAKGLRMRFTFGVTGAAGGQYTLSTSALRR